MSLSMFKSVRDGSLVGLTTAVVMGVLIQHGLDPIPAGIVGAAVGGFVARNYRYLRTRNNWLGRYLRGIDPPAEANSLS